MKLKFSKNKLIAIIGIIGVLVFAFWFGGNAPGLQGWNVKPEASKIIEDNTDLEDKDVAKEVLKEVPKEEPKEDKLEETPEEEPKEDEVIAVIESEEKEGIESILEEEKDELSKKMEINQDTGKDKYLTDPVPEGKPIPIEPENSKITNIEKYCTLSIRADTILDNIEWLDPDKVELVPKDGVIYATQKVMFYEGESVFNLLLREMKKSKIHMEFTNTPIYNSAYIEGINNLYEFDCGELSGWMYKVNGWFPNYGASRYALKEGDVVEWVYTCDLGADVGGYSAVGGE